MTKSKIELRWEIDSVKVVLLAVFNPKFDKDLINECNNLYEENIKNYCEVVIFFFKSGDLLDNFVELFLGKNKSEEDALFESRCYAKFIGSTLTFNETPEDIEMEILLNSISITQRIGIDNYKLRNYTESQPK